MESLPVELLTSILSFTQEQTSVLLPFPPNPGIEISTLHSLSLTSKTLHRLTTPILCSSFNERGSTRRLPLFLITILKYLTLASYVKTFSGTSFQYPPWSAVADEDNSPDWATRSPDVELWTDADKDIIRKAVEEAMMTLKLARYPRNHMGEVGRGDEEFAERWMKRMFSSTVKYTSDAIVALLLCYLPNLGSFKVDTYNDDRLGLRGFTFTYRVLSSLAYNDNATHLHTISLSLTNSLVRPILLRHLISTFSSLNIKNFSYAVLRPRQTHASGKRWPAATVISPDDIYYILTKLPMCLENLALSILHGHSHGATESWRADRQLGCFGVGAGGVLWSLERFMQLRVLRASAYLVLGDPVLFRGGEMRIRSWEGEGTWSCRYDESQVAAFFRRLPSCVEILVLEDCERAVGGLVRDFLEMRLREDAAGARRLRLRRIEIGYRYPKPSALWSIRMRDEDVIDDEDWGDENELKDFAERMGIVLVQRVEDNYRRFPS